LSSSWERDSHRPHHLRGGSEHLARSFRGGAPREPFYFLQDGDIAHYTGVVHRLENPNIDQEKLAEVISKRETTNPLPAESLRKS
jgi:hypothetical protein